MMHTLRERSRKSGTEKGQRYSNEFRRNAVEQMRGCNNIVRLARELGICRRVLYNWRDQLDETSPPPVRSWSDPLKRDSFIMRSWRGRQFSN